MSQKIIPNLWFDHNAEEAVNFYMSVFKDAKILATYYYPLTEAEGSGRFSKRFSRSNAVN